MLCTDIIKIKILGLSNGGGGTSKYSFVVLPKSFEISPKTEIKVEVQ